jgi:hypothetical protein
MTQNQPSRSPAEAYGVAVPKALWLLCTKKSREQRFQRALAKWICALLTLMGAGAFLLCLLPAWMAAAVFAYLCVVFGLSTWLMAGNMFLEFALNDVFFFELALNSRALRVLHTQVPASDSGNTKQYYIVFRARRAGMRRR